MLTVREGLRLFGFPDDYDMSSVSYRDAFDLLGNSVSVNAVRMVSDRLIRAQYQDISVKNLPEPCRSIPEDQQFAFGTALESV